MELQSGVLTLAECYPRDVTYTSYDVIVHIYDAILHQFSMKLQTEILSTETSGFLKQIIFLISFNSVFKMHLDLKVLQRIDRNVLSVIFPTLTHIIRLNR